MYFKIVNLYKKHNDNNKLYPIASLFYGPLYFKVFLRWVFLWADG